MDAAAGLALARRINGERVVVLGWPRAILLQVAHPLVAAAVYQHSTFRNSPSASVTRLRATVRAMLAITFGDDTRRAGAVEGIRAIHRRVHGELQHEVGRFRVGSRYSAEDPALLVWVHTTLIESIVVAYEKFVRPLAAAERDVYCAVSSSLPVELGAVGTDVPTTWDALVAFNRDTIASGTLAIGPETRELAEALLDGGVSRLVPPARWLNRTLTIGLLPEPVRDLYGLRWTAAHDGAFARVTRSIRAARRYTPAMIARFADARAAG